MATRHISLQTDALTDAIYLLSGFQEHSEHQVEVTLEYQKQGKKEGLLVTARAWKADQEDGGRTLSASVSLTTFSMSLKTLMGVLSQLLYALDFQLELNAYRKEEDKRA